MSAFENIQQETEEIIPPERILDIPDVLEMIQVARGLNEFSDDLVSENPEYLRGQVEFIYYMSDFPKPYDEMLDEIERLIGLSDEEFAQEVTKMYKRNQ